MAIGEEVLQRLEQLPNEAALQELEVWLTEQIMRLLQDHPEQLWQAFYRIDVGEEQVRQVLAHDIPAEIPKRLARLIIQRQLQKLETRRRFHF